MDARLRWHDGRDRGSKPLFRNGDRACLIDGKAGVPRDFPDIAVWIGDMGAIAAPGHVARRVGDCAARPGPRSRSEEHTSELQSLMRISYAVFCLKKKHRKKRKQITNSTIHSTHTHNTSTT